MQLKQPNPGSLQIHNTNNLSGVDGVSRSSPRQVPALKPGFFTLSQTVTPAVQQDALKMNKINKNHQQTPNVCEWGLLV